jgi:hypothetical protein
MALSGIYQARDHQNIVSKSGDFDNQGAIKYYRMMPIFKYLFTLIYIIIFSNVALCQKQDYIWLYGDEPYDVVLPIRAADTTRGACNIDFNYDPPKLYYDPKRFLDFLSCNTSVCDNNGNVLAYSNGMVIYNQFDKAITDTINYSDDWEYSKIEYQDKVIPGGLLGIQYALMLPDPSKSERYFTFYSTRDRSNTFYNRYMIRYALIEVSQTEKEGKLISKDTKIIQDSLSGSMTAIRHGNGRDWWLIAPRRNGVEAFIFLIDQNGVHYNGNYITGFSPPYKNGGIGQVYSSPDGKWISWFVSSDFTAQGGKIVLNEFNRCSGIISNSQIKTVDLSDFRLALGVSFSYNSNYLYMCNSEYIYQYDLKNENPLNFEKKSSNI